MTTLKSSSQASTYYSKDNYYTKEPTAESLEKAEWYGKGAEVLGLENQEFDADKFKELLEGNIDDENKIGRVTYQDGVAVTQHRPGVDLTFSAPKSVSILSEVFKNDDVRQAHEDAVKATLDLVEEKYAQTRISVDGSMQKVDTENLVVALFSHNNSRDLDPQTHTHAVVMNATLNEKGEWSALSNEQIYKNQKLIGAIYNSELASNLKDLGYGLDFKANGNFEISGIDQNVIDEFSQRRKAMLENAEERGIDLSTASASVREVIALDTRTVKKNVTQESLDNDWSERASAFGLTKEYVEKLIDPTKIIEKKSEDKGDRENNINDKETSFNREDDKKESNEKDDKKESNEKDGKKGKENVGSHEERTPEIKPGNEQGNDGIEKHEGGRVEHKDEKIGSGKEEVSNDHSGSNEGELNKSWMDRLWAFFKKDDIAVASSNKEGGLNQKQQDVEELSERERSIREAVFYAVGHHTEREMLVSRSEIEATALKKSEGNFKYKDINNEVDRLLKNEILVETDKGKITTQRLAHSEIWSIDHVREERHSVDKILTEDQIKTDLKEREQFNKFEYTEGQRNSIYSIFTTDSRYHAVDGLAGTGKTTMLLALNKIAEKNGFITKGMAATGVAAKNLEEETGIPSSTIAMFKYHESKLQNELNKSESKIDRKNEIWVVDESSFASQEGFAEILKLAKDADSRVVFLGDKLQLQSIEAGKPFEILQNEMSFSSMENINRQKTQELKDVVSLITAKNPKGEITLSENVKAFDLLDKQGSVIEHNQMDLHQELVNAYMKNDVEKRNSSLIITPFNSDRKILNGMVRDAKIQNGELTGEEHNFTTYMNKNLTNAQKGESTEYEKGDVLRFSKTYSPDGQSFKKDEYYTVVETYKKTTQGKKEEGLILKDKNGLEQKWNSKNKNQIEVYEKEQKELRKGDLIKINRTNGEFKNGEKYSFKKIEGNEIILTNEKNEEKRMPKEEFNHWDHGYANTIYSSQGLTKSNVFMLINSNKLSNTQNNEQAVKNLGKIFGNRAFYVGATRASMDLKVFTHDKDIARGAVGYEQDKSSYAQETQYGNNEKQFDQGKGLDIEF